MNGPAAATTDSIVLAEREARLLQSHLARHLRWNPRAYVRVLVDGDHIGVYAAPPTKVITFISLPIARTDARLDSTVMAAHMVFGDVTRGRVTLDLPEPLASAADLAVLPPQDEWHLPLYGISGDVMPEVESAIAEFKTRAVSSTNPDALAEEIWSRNAFGGLPMRVLHTARMLGMLTDDSSRIAAATRTGWKRLTLIRGQIYVRVPGALDRPKLTVVR